MKVGPDIAEIAALLGDPARANMLMALLSGQALTASELADEGGVSRSTASSHLARLEAGGLLAQARQGRHRYFRLSGPDVSDVLERLMVLSARASRPRTRPGPREPELRRARVCYDHLAGAFGVRLFEGLTARGVLTAAEQPELTAGGQSCLRELGVDPIPGSRRPLCLSCLDWSERRPHLAGALGAHMLTMLYERGLARRKEGSRVVQITPAGVLWFDETFPQDAEEGSPWLDA